MESPSRAISANQDDFLVGRTKVNWTTNCYLNCKFVICASQFEFLIILSMLTWQETCENGQLRNFPPRVTASTIQHSWGWTKPSRRPCATATPLTRTDEPMPCRTNCASAKQVHSPATTPVASHYPSNDQGCPRGFPNLWRSYRTQYSHVIYRQL